MTNREYWKKRAEERKNHVSRTADEAAREAREAYERARHQINKEVAYWIQKFADAEGISYEEARKQLEAGEMESYRMTLEEYIRRGEQLEVDPSWQDAMVAASALHHIDRLTALKSIIRAELEENKAKQKNTDWMHDVADYSFQQTLFSIETDAEVAIQFRLPDLDTLHQDIEEAWAPDGMNFVERVGVNNDKLAAEVDRLITQACITGESYEELAKQLEAQFALKEYEAERIMRTEATRVATMSEMAAYKAAGIEEYEILVTLDERTCKICGPMDGHVEKVENMEPGVTAPPFHPNCRCTTIGHYEDDLIDETRIARDENGDPIHVDGDMTWEEFQKEFVEGNPKYEARIKAYNNQQSDRELMEKYRVIFGSEVPNNLADFQKLKYNDPEKWEKLKREKQERLDSTPYKKLSRLDGKLGNLEVRSWYKHQNELIPEKVGKSGSLEERAKRAFEMRNQNKANARALMKDEAERQRLDKEEPPKTFEELVQDKMTRKEMNREEALADVIETSAKTRRSVNERFGLE